MAPWQFVCLTCYAEMRDAYDDLLAAKNAVVKELHDMKALNESLAERVFAQHELLSRRAEK